MVTPVDPTAAAVQVPLQMATGAGPQDTAGARMFADLMKGVGANVHGGQCDTAQVWPRTDPTDGAVSFLPAQFKGIPLECRCHDRHVKRLGNSLVRFVVGTVKIHPALLE